MRNAYIIARHQIRELKSPVPLGDHANLDDDSAQSLRHEVLIQGSREIDLLIHAQLPSFPAVVSATRRSGTV